MNRLVLSFPTMSFDVNQDVFYPVKTKMSKDEFRPAFISHIKKVFAEYTAINKRCEDYEKRYIELSEKRNNDPINYKHNQKDIDSELLFIERGLEAAQQEQSEFLYGHIGSEDKIERTCFTYDCGKINVVQNLIHSINIDAIEESFSIFTLDEWFEEYETGSKGMITP